VMYAARSAPAGRAGAHHRPPHLQDPLRTDVVLALLVVRDEVAGRRVAPAAAAGRRCAVAAVLLHAAESP